MVEVLLSVHINPLDWPAFDDYLRNREGKEPDNAEVLNFLCQPEASHQVNDIMDRYAKLSVGNDRLFVVPSETRILDKLVWPLRHAKSSFMLGNYIGTIALCGYVGEMLAILLFDIARVPRGSTAAFQKVNHFQRIHILRALGEIDDETEKLFRSVSSVRNKALHVLSAEKQNLETDANTVYGNTISLVIRGLGLQIVEPGKIKFSDRFMNYLRECGLIANPPPKTS